MAKMKWGSDVPWKDLDDAEYDEEGDFEPYDGPIPPKGTVLSGELKKLWIAESQTGNTMFKALFEADGNEGEKKQYDGCPLWDNVLFTLPNVKFRWQPFLDAFGITLRDIKAKTIVGEEDNVGTVVDKIGSMSIPASCRVLTSVEAKGEYKGSARINKWLPPADDADLADDDYEEGDDPF